MNFVPFRDAILVNDKLYTRRAAVLNCPSHLTIGDSTSALGLPFTLPFQTHHRGMAIP
jgi:hypothetical protein